jgi:hypothetical protein
MHGFVTVMDASMGMVRRTKRISMSSSTARVLFFAPIGIVPDTDGPEKAHNSIFD